LWDVFDPSLAVVNSTEEESRGSEMLDIHPLATIKEQGGSYSVSSYWVVERVKKLSCSWIVMRRFWGSTFGFIHCD
jgi:hypothetical protein